MRGYRRFICPETGEETLKRSSHENRPNRPQQTKGSKAARKREKAVNEAPERFNYPGPSDVAEEDRKAVLAIGKCEKCGFKYKLTVDHVIPRALGGSSARNNLQCLCERCNQKKADSFPIHLLK